MIRVGVFGAGGRMGATVCQAVAADPELELVAAVDPHHAGLDLRPASASTSRPAHRSPTPRHWPRRTPRSRSTSPSSTRPATNLRWCAAHGVHAVVGTTGFTDDDFDRAARGASPRSNCVDRPQLRDRRGADDALRRAGGAVVRDRRDHRAAPRREDRRAVGHRHAHGASAWPPRPPSGRADPTTEVVVEGARGGEGPARHPRALGAPARPGRPPGGAARHHRARASSIRHDTYDRTSFMPGVLLAVKEVADHPASPSASTAVLSGCVGVVGALPRYYQSSWSTSRMLASKSS